MARPMNSKSNATEAKVMISIANILVRQQKGGAETMGPTYRVFGLRGEDVTLLQNKEIWIMGYAT